MSITLTNQIILIHNFNFDEKFDSRNLTKMTNLHHVLIYRDQIEIKKTGGPT